MALPITKIDPAKEFSGGKNITPDSDVNPELGDLIYQLQDELNVLGATGFAPTILTEKGDIPYASAPSTVAALHHGAAGDFLTSGGHAADPTWTTPGTMAAEAAADYVAKALVTEQGDIVYASAASTPAALPHGTAGDVLASGGHGANPAWSSRLTDVETWAASMGMIAARIQNLDLKTDEQDKTGALAGLVTKGFVPAYLVIKVITNVGAVNCDGTINVGTAVDGAQIAAAVALTGLDAVDAMRFVPLAANTAKILGNATLHANTEAAETGLGTLAMDVYVVGPQF